MATYNNSNKSMSKPQDNNICLYSFNSRGFNLENSNSAMTCFAQKTMLFQFYAIKKTLF